MATLKELVEVALGRRRVWINSSRVHLETFVKRAAASLNNGSRVLDAGAGQCPYRPLFKDVRYESADIRQTGAIDYVCDLCSIPVEDSRYDLVLMSQAFCHMADPLAALTEMRRVLRADGCLWLSTPFYYEEVFQPYDFYRYTQFGLRHVLSVAGFEVLELSWLEGYCGTASHQLSSLADGLPRSPGDYGGGRLGTLTATAVLAARPFMRLLALILVHADQRNRFTAGGHCINYCVVARKRSS